MVDLESIFNEYLYSSLKVALFSSILKVSMIFYLFFWRFFLSISSLNDDMYHTLIYQRRGMKVNALVDDDAPVVAEIMGTERKMDYSEMHVGGKAFEILVYFFPSMCFLSNLLHIYLVNNRLNYLNFQLTPWHKLKNLTWLLKRPQLMNSPHVTMYVISNDKFVDSNSWFFTSSQLWNWIDRV